MKNKEIEIELVKLMCEIKTCVSKSPTIFLKSTKNKCYLLLEGSMNLIKNINDLGDKDIFDIQIYKQYIEIEKSYKNISSFLIFWPLIFSICLLMLLSIVIYKNIEYLSATINMLFGINAPERLIIIGILGAIMYLFTSILNRQEYKSVGEPAWMVLTFIVRIIVSIIVPILLVVLFFSSDGAIKSLRITPELLSFGCGYSSKLVIDILNKIIQKCSSMINSL